MTINASLNNTINRKGVNRFLSLCGTLFWFERGRTKERTTKGITLNFFQVYTGTVKIFCAINFVDYWQGWKEEGPGCKNPGVPDSHTEIKCQRGRTERANETRMKAPLECGETQNALWKPGDFAFWNWAGTALEMSAQAVDTLQHGMETTMPSCLLWGEKAMCAETSCMHRPA